MSRLLSLLNTFRESVMCMNLIFVSPLFHLMFQTRMLMWYIFRLIPALPNLRIPLPVARTP